MDIPIPRIFDWSTETCNPVGAEYILEEKAEGRPLGSIWAELSSDVRSNIVDQIVGVEKKLGPMSFPKHGYIYYESDLKPSHLKYERIESSSIQNKETPAFVIGPSADPNLWRLERAQMDLDRGPCKARSEGLIS